MMNPRLLHKPILALALGAACLGLYAEALLGPFISDDSAYIVTNPFVRSPQAGWFSGIFEPGGPAQLHAMGNYAPVQIIVHAFEWRMFGEQLATTSSTSHCTWRTACC
jgi:hypothetical protein